MGSAFTRPQDDTIGTLALDLSGNYDAGAATLSGIVGAIAMLAVIYGGRAMGMTRMDLLRTLGTMVAPRASSTKAYAIGTRMHLMMGAAFGLVHADILRVLDPSTDGGATALGLVIGLVHGLIVTMAMLMMLTMAHPLVRDGEIERPGVMLTGFGSMTGRRHDGARRVRPGRRRRLRGCRRLIAGTAHHRRHDDQQRANHLVQTPVDDIFGDRTWSARQPA